MDPLSITGLTIAVLDQLWKIGNGTAELVSNYRDFDTDTRVLENKIKDENNRTRALHLLLFEQSSSYEGKSLFEQFDKDVQDQIHFFLEQASDVLEQAYRLLDRRQNTDTKDRDLQFPAKPVFAATLSSVPSSTSLGSVNSMMKRPRPLQRIKWSLMDKKRVGTIVQDFSELNGRIHENIKLWCLGTSIGVNLQHLNRLKTDDNSRTLGFDADASTLQLVTSQNQIAAQSLEIDDPSLRRCAGNARLFGDKFGIFDRGGTACLVEYHSYSPDSPVPVPLDDQTRVRVDKLANLLHQPKDIAFRTPRLQGWVRQTQKNRIAYIFSLPAAAEQCPTSLLDILSRKDLHPPSLSQRFCLAVKLSRCISQLHLVKWVHKSFRSENIIFFFMVDSEGSALPEKELNLSQPWLLGFEFSRLEDHVSHGRADSCLSQDIYRHPERQQNPTHFFNKIHDIYALGVILLEIGLWQPVLTLEKSGFSRIRDPHAIKNHLIKHAEKRLRARMGDKYQKIVLKCLKGDFDVVDDTKEDLKLQQAFRANVVDQLQRSADSI